MAHGLMVNRMYIIPILLFFLYSFLFLYPSSQIYTQR